MLRLLLIVLLINGLAPALGEAVELMVHYVAAGHLAHFEPGEDDLGETAQEHGCGPTAHQCGCCHSQSVVPVTVARLSLLAPESTGLIPSAEQKMAAGERRRLLRPPIPA